jgi:hypothetical protein
MSGHVMYMCVKGIDFVVTILRIIEHFYITKWNVVSSNPAHGEVVKIKK